MNASRLRAGAGRRPTASRSATGCSRSALLGDGRQASPASSSSTRARRRRPARRHRRDAARSPPTWCSRRSARRFVPADVDGAATLDARQAAASRSTPSGRTSLAGVWAGGDCVAGGEDLTVAAVEDGKQAALSIDRTRAPRRAQLSEEHDHGRSPQRISSASSRPTRSGWPPRRRPTRTTTSCAPSRPAGAAWSGRRSARRPAGRQRQRPALRRDLRRRTAGCSASTTSS